MNLTDPSGAFVNFLIKALIVLAFGFAASAINALIHGASFYMAMRRVRSGRRRPR